MLEQKLEKKVIIEYAICSIIICVLLYAFSRHVIGGEMPHNTHKGFYFWRAIIAIGCVSIFSYAPNYKNVLMYIFTAAYFAVAYFLLLRTGFKVNSPDLWNWQLNLWIGIGTAVPILFDALVSKRFCKLDRQRVMVLIFFALSYATMIYNRALTSNDEIYFFAIVLLYYCVEFNTESIKRFMKCFALASVANAAYWLIKCCLSVPFAGETHYKGIFMDAPIFAELMGAGAVCCLALLLVSSSQSRPAKINRIGLIILILVFSFMVFISNSRNTLLGLLAVLLLFFYYYSVIVDKKRIFKSILAAMLIIGALITALALVLAINRDKLAGVFSRVPQLEYLASIAIKSMIKDSRYGIIPDNSWLNCIDNFTSGRLSIWIVTIKQLKLFSGNSSYIYITEEYQNGVHNAFLSFMNTYGIIGGLLISILLIMSCVIFVKRAMKDVKRKEKNALYIIPALWSFYSFFICLFETPGFGTWYISSWLIFAGLCFNSQENDLDIKKCAEGGE